MFDEIRPEFYHFPVTELIPSWEHKSHPDKSPPDVDISCRLMTTCRNISQRLRDRLIKDLEERFP